MCAAPLEAAMSRNGIVFRFKEETSVAGPFAPNNNTPVTRWRKLLADAFREDLREDL